MASSTSAPTTIFILFALTSSLLFCPSSCTASFSHHHNLTAVFAFGDSTVDPGNNNYIRTLFVSNHPPYGRDFPGHRPTGRFTNGRLVTDFMVSYLGLKQFVPAFLDPSLEDEELLTGVSFASSGSGIDDETAALAHLLTMHTQVGNFKKALQRIEALVGHQEATRIINNAVFVISAGTNDILNNFYWLPFSHRKLQFSLPQYHDFLLDRLWHIFRVSIRPFPFSLFLSAFCFVHLVLFLSFCCASSGKQIRRLIIRSFYCLFFSFFSFLNFAIHLASFFLSFFLF